MKIEFYANFSKRQNSTKLPPPDLSPVEYDCQLTESCNLVAPTIWLAGWHDYSYAFIPAWHRYYYVTDTNFVNSRTYITLQEDYLASWRSGILGSTFYVTRAAADYNGDIIDTRYPSLPDTHEIVVIGDSPFGVSNVYAVQIAGRNGIGNYMMTQEQLDMLSQLAWYNYLTAPIDEQTIPHFIDPDMEQQYKGMFNLIRSISDPMQYILSVKGTKSGFWLSEGTYTPSLGWYADFPVTVPRLYNVTTHTYTISVPKHPDADNLPYLKSSAYSAYSIFIPGCGWVPLNADLLYNVSEIKIHYWAEPYQGNCTASVMVGTAEIAHATGNLMWDWGIGSNKNSIGGAMLSTAGAAVSAARHNYLGAASGIGNAITSLIPTYSYHGGVASNVELVKPIKIKLEYQSIVERNLADNGAPLMEQRTLGSLPGFVVCEGAEFTGAALTGENSAISATLNGGVYIE